MMNNSTIEALKAMRFSAMATEFERQLGDPAAYSQLGFEERFALMVDAEWNRRQQNRLARCIREAHFAAPGAMIEDIEYHEDRRLGDRRKFCVIDEPRQYENLRLSQE